MRIPGKFEKVVKQVMSGKEDLQLNAQQKVELASLQERREATLASIAEVEATKKAVLWTLNNKWLGLKSTLRRQNEMIKELEGVSSIGGSEASAGNLRHRAVMSRKVLKGEEAYCQKCYKVILPDRLHYENGNCARCERNRLLRLEHLAKAKCDKFDKQFKDTVK